MASRNKSKSSGLRILWIPGKKHNPKGNLSPTNKRISYNGPQKKSEVWSLGGSRAQRDLINAEPDTSLLDSPSDSNRLAPVTYTVGASAAAAAVAAESSESKPKSESPLHAPCTPNSTTSTAPLLSNPQSPQTYSSIESGDDMPTKQNQSSPGGVQTTTAQIILDQNRFSILGKDLPPEEGNIYEIPVVHNSNHHHPHHLEHQCDTLPLNNSAGTNVSTATTSPALSNKSDAKNKIELYSSPSRKKHRNHNNNQADVNSIESIADDEKTDDTSRKINVPNKDVLFVDELLSDDKSDSDSAEKNDPTLNAAGVVTNVKRKKKKKQNNNKTKDLDQLDGVTLQKNAQKELLKQQLQQSKNNKDKLGKDTEDEDEKMVKCLYYTLMCCDCAIS